jgi:hypothetical protein
VYENDGCDDRGKDALKDADTGCGRKEPGADDLYLRR